MAGRHYYVKDHLSLITMILNSSGDVDSYNDYYPYGMQMPGRNSTASADARYKYTSKELDAETNLYYFGARYYNSWSGQWGQVDPMTDENNSFSPYSYAVDNPISVTDEGGMDSTSIPTSSKVYPPIVTTAKWDWEPSSWWQLFQMATDFFMMYPNHYLYNINTSNWSVERKQISPIPPYVEGIMPGSISDDPVIGPSGLKDATQGLKDLFEGGTIMGKSIIEIRETLFENGFTQTSTANGEGYLFKNSTGEQVRLMRRDGGWDVRVRNSAGNYLDEFGNVPSDAKSAHNIEIFPK
jgi:RHS repeat-associated protein